jgi:septin family protein
MTVISLSLISHTNVGKTTLARTLLRRDVGEIRDASHVTLQSSRHTLLETATGDALELWDTPGFGDSVRLLRRLELSSNPLGWFLSHVWDRYADRPFFSSQQALRIARDHAGELRPTVEVTAQ